MLVKRFRRQQGGSSLVTVVVLMMVLSVLALTTAAVTLSTTRGLVTTRHTTQARAAADAGLAAVVADFRRLEDCPATKPSRSGSVIYSTQCTKAGNYVTFRSTGKAQSGTTVVLEAIYRLPPPVPDKEPALVTRAPLDLNSLTIKAVNPAVPSTVWVIPEAGGSGDFSCNSGGAIAGSVYLPAGAVFGAGGCEVKGDVYAERSISISSGTRIHGDLVSLNGSVTISGGNTIGGSIFAKGNVTGTSLSNRFVQSIHTTGNLSLSGGAPSARDTITYGGTFTYPHSGHDAWAQNSVMRIVVDPPQLPTAPKWAGFTQDDLDDLVDAGKFTRVTWTGACGYSWWPEHEMIAKIKGFTTPTLVDARHCARLDLHEYSGETTIKTDIIFLAPSFNLQDQKFKSADGAKHHLWFIAPDDPGVNCSTVPPVNLQGSRMLPAGGTSKISGMIFTPCTVHYDNGGEDWQGSIHAGKMTGKPNFWYDPVGFPGGSAPGGGGGGGGTPFEMILESLREVP